MSEEVRQLLGFAAAGYYQKFVEPDVSQITDPCPHQLLMSDPKSPNAISVFGDKRKEHPTLSKVCLHRIHTGLS